ncbi:MAG TPA: hypothetical protein VGW76_14300 [Pyrinomonadaceae bacterium]|nr:hypothetical protein [Pyrinomonadaceae bacterium]
MRLERLPSAVPITPVILLLTALYLPLVSGQQSRLPQHTAPPPLKIITRAERAQLNEAKDEKARVKLTLELAETHLANVETQTTQQQYDAAAAEAGMYWALFEDVFGVLKRAERDNNKKRDLYKRLELALRAHGTRLSAVRRTTPAEYAVWIKELEDFARSSRTEALNSFYGHTVIREAPRKPDAKETKPLQED